MVVCDTADKSVGYFHSSAPPIFEANRIANRRPNTRVGLRASSAVGPSLHNVIGIELIILILFVSQNSLTLCTGSHTIRIPTVIRADVS